MEDSIDLDALRTSVAEILAEECDRETVLRHVAESSGPLLPLWEKVSELGWLMLAIPEEHGGLGLGTAALVPLYEELGRVAAPLPFLVSMLAADSILQAASDAQKAQWLPRIASGEIATLSLPSARAPELRIRHDGDAVILTGIADELIDADSAALILLLARDEDGSLHRVVLEKGDDAPLETSALWDHGHRVSTLRADALRLPAARAFATTDEAEAALLAHAALGLAAEAVGGSEGILDITIDYMKTREQFGRPIGSFQALKHRVADHRTQAFAARHLVEAAGAMLSGEDADWAREASAAKALACRAFAEIARDCIQLHGGIGFTAEQACHLYLKRANLNALLFGDEAAHLAIATRALFSRESV
ncbi:acyl-CoA/acyl-ACP dehydrogenase [Sphingobium sp. JS3065]|uniref:acyl-CoA dehydrogenase family protein n=1 Tax=Sphingobium sp. JS3065 TaxID=2970925 RepID=UPI0022643862|nr:acyl-CoA dehydrogenase family protein [Sphingobium sp. JS3065]UZW57414.1 acyl-CoA/acyl-ACP dehydrogenase [Sphingobium sp. JS3065]